VRKLALLLLLLSSTSHGDTLAFYLLKQGLKQGSLYLKAEPVDEVLSNARINPVTESYLLLSKKILSFAKNNLGLKTKKNYQKYVNIDNSWITQVVTAAHKDQLKSYLFYYPLFGKLPYKGFFEEEDAKILQNELVAKGYDTYRRGVTAFSSTGWFSDPILSSMFVTRAYFIQTILHELVHVQFYIKSQANFNEAFATWYAHRASLDFIAHYKNSLHDYKKIKKELMESYDKQRRLTDLVVKVKKKGHEIYSGKGSVKEKRARYFSWVKKRFIANDFFTEKLTDLKINNAWIMALGTYFGQIPYIEKYAKANNISYKDLLKKMTRQKASLMKKMIPKNLWNGNL